MNKKQLIKEVDKLFRSKVTKNAKERCEVCNSPVRIAVHHFIPRSLAGHLKFYIPNGVLLCSGCHFSHHTRSDPKIHGTIIKQRGMDWYNHLQERRKETHSSYQTVEYYQKLIEEFNDKNN